MAEELISIFPLWIFQISMGFFLLNHPPAARHCQISHTSVSSTPRERRERIRTCLPFRSSEFPPSVIWVPPVLWVRPQFLVLFVLFDI